MMKKLLAIALLSALTVICFPAFAQDKAADKKDEKAAEAKKADPKTADAKAAEAKKEEKKDEVAKKPKKGGC